MPCRQGHQIRASLLFQSCTDSWGTIEAKRLFVDQVLHAGNAVILALDNFRLHSSEQELFEHSI